MSTENPTERAAVLVDFVFETLNVCSWAIPVVTVRIVSHARQDSFTVIQLTMFRNLWNKDIGNRNCERCWNGIGTGVGYFHSQDRSIALAGRIVLDHLHDIHSRQNDSEDGVFVVEPVRFHGVDVELTSVRVWSICGTYRHVDLYSMYGSGITRNSGALGQNIQTDMATQPESLFMSNIVRCNVNFGFC